MKEKGLSYYIAEAKKLRGLEQKADVRIALLATFTINGLKDILNVKCHQISLRSSIYESGYNQVYQEIADPGSGLRQFDPQVTFLLINPNFVFGEQLVNLLEEGDKRSSYINQKLDEFIQTIQAFFQGCPGYLVVSNLKGFSSSPLGIGDERTPFSLKDMAHAFNRGLKEAFLGNSRVFIHDMEGFFVRYGEYNIINEKFHYLADMFIGPDYLPALGEDLMGYIKPLCSRNRKCLVLDLDNTLWGGIVGEDGFDNIKLDNKSPGNCYMDFQRHILELHKRGVILAINSRNNHGEAIEVIRKHPYMVLKEEHFACLRINWNDKASNLREIAQELNIGTDSLVFVDDDPVNRALVKEAMPEVLVPDLPEDPALYVRSLKQLNDFNTLQITEEDFKKGAMYFQQRKREELKAEISDFDDFLQNLEQKVDIHGANSFTIPRISQLTLKTNQFNLTTRRYTDDDIRRLSEHPDYLVYAVKVADRFGDNGYVGVFIIHKSSDMEWLIDTFLLSCRVIGRKIEKAMLNAIFRLAKKQGIDRVVGEYIPSAKNVQTARFYPDHVFSEAGNNRFVIESPGEIEGLGCIVVTLS